MVVRTSGLQFHSLKIANTSGEIRLSDFLLWQSAFSCVYFCPVLWPDFSVYHLYLTILYYQQNYETYQVNKKENDAHRAVFDHGQLGPEQELASSKRVEQFLQLQKLNEEERLRALRILKK